MSDLTHTTLVTPARATEIARVVHVTLPNGTSIPRELCLELRRQVEDALRWLPPGVTCDIRDLVTPRFWLPLRKPMRADLGRFLAYWVAQGEFPLEFVSPPRSHNKRYRRRG